METTKEIIIPNNLGKVKILFPGTKENVQKGVDRINQLLKNEENQKILASWNNGSRL